MKRMTLALCAVVGLAMCAGTSQASWGHLHYSGYQPWWNIFAKRYKCLTPEEERLQKFWHDYYHSLKTFYKHLDAIDWVAYYKNHGYAINAGPCGPNGGCGRINYAPVFVSPTMQWAIPAGATGGPPVGPGGGPGFGGPPMGFGGPGFGGPPMGFGGGMPMGPMGPMPMGALPMGPMGGMPMGFGGGMPMGPMGPMGPMATPMGPMTGNLPAPQPAPMDK